MGQGTKDCFHIFQHAVELTLVGPIELDHFGALFFQNFGALLSKRSGVVVAVSLPDTHTDILVSGFEEGNGNTETNNTRSGRDTVAERVRRSRRRRRRHRRVVKFQWEKGRKWEGKE